MRREPAGAVIAWTCRGCRIELIVGERRREAAEADWAAQRADAAARGDYMTRTLAEIALLPQAVRDRLHAGVCALRVAPLHVNPGSPLYDQLLVKAFERFNGTNGSPGF